MQFMKESVTKIAENIWNFELRIIYLIFNLLLR